MWTKIQLKNFRGYADTGLQDLRPLTIFIGPNGGGKSTLLKLFMALKQTAESSDTTTTLITSVDPDKRGYVDLGLYPDYVYQGNTRKHIQVFLAWENKRSRQQVSMFDIGKAQAINLQFGYRQTGKQVVIQKLEYRGSKNGMKMSTKDEKMRGKVLVSLSRQSKGAYKPEIPQEKEWKISNKDGVSKLYEPQKFYRFSPDFLADITSWAEAGLRLHVQEFENQILHTYYLGPLRENPQRYYEATGERPGDLGVKGQHMGAVLYADKDTDGGLIDLTSKWLNQLDIADSLSLSRMAKGNLFHLEIHGKSQKSHVNITDYGFGVSQILPVIVESLYSPNESTLLIEQPEIHLNAHQQLELPNFFVDLVQKTNKQFLIETHSEYFLKRLGTLVAQRKLSSRDVIIYYCHTDDEGSHMMPIEFDDLGRASWWPEQFLSEGFEGSVEHMEAMELRQEEE